MTTAATVITILTKIIIGVTMMRRGIGEISKEVQVVIPKACTVTEMKAGGKVITVMEDRQKMGVIVQVKDSMTTLVFIVIGVTRVICIRKMIVHIVGTIMTVVIAKTDMGGMIGATTILMMTEE
jgi:hypothetical protein